MKSRQLSSCTSPLEHRSDSSSSAFRQISSSLSADIALQHPSDWSATPADLPPAPLSHTHTPSLSHTRARARVPRKRRTGGAAATPLDRFRALDALAKSTETTLLLLLPLVLSCLSAFFSVSRSFFSVLSVRRSSLKLNHHWAFRLQQRQSRSLNERSAFTALNYSSVHWDAERQTGSSASTNPPITLNLHHQHHHSAIRAAEKPEKLHLVENTVKF